jgi:hypothetical protein
MSERKVERKERGERRSEKRGGGTEGEREGGREGGLTGVVVALDDSNGQSDLRHAEGVGLQGRVEGLGEVRLLLSSNREGDECMWLDWNHIYHSFPFFSLLPPSLPPSLPLPGGR